MKRLVLLVATLAILSPSALAWERPICDYTNDHAAPYCITTEVQQNSYGAEAIIAFLLVGKEPQLVLMHPEWSMAQRTGLMVQVQVDSYSEVPRLAYSKDDRLYIVLQPTDLPFFQKGNLVRITMPRDSRKYSLKGSRAAINALLQAYENFAGGSDPFGGSPVSTTDPFAGAPGLRS